MISEVDIFECRITCFLQESYNYVNWRNDDLTVKPLSWGLVILLCSCVLVKGMNEWKKFICEVGFEEVELKKWPRWSHLSFFSGEYKRQSFKLSTKCEDHFFIFIFKTALHIFLSKLYVLFMNDLYLCLLFVYILKMNVPGHSKVCYFANFSFSDQHITSSKITVNDLTKK